MSEAWYRPAVPDETLIGFGHADGHNTALLHKGAAVLASSSLQVSVESCLAAPVPTSEDQKPSTLRGLVHYITLATCTLLTARPAASSESGISVYILFHSFEISWGVYHAAVAFRIQPSPLTDPKTLKLDQSDHFETSAF